MAFAPQNLTYGLCAAQIRLIRKCRIGNRRESALKLVIFDCDGTLVDSQRMICGAMQRAYDAHAIVCPPRETVLSIVGLSLREAFQVLGHGEANFPIDGLIEQYKQAFFALRPLESMNQSMNQSMSQAGQSQRQHQTSS